MKPYELSELARDLVILARYMLKPRGRLVFFLPTVTEEYEELDIQAMLCDGMELVANSLQNFGSWGRRVGVPAAPVWRGITDATTAHHDTEGDGTSISASHLRPCTCGHGECGCACSRPQGLPREVLPRLQEK